MESAASEGRAGGAPDRIDDLGGVRPDHESTFRQPLTPDSGTGHPAGEPPGTRVAHGRSCRLGAFREPRRHLCHTLADVSTDDAPIGGSNPAGELRHPTARRRQPQIFARDVRLPPDAPLVYLAAGAAKDLRDAARAGHLRCPLPGCEQRRLTTRGGPTVRDHFVHLNRPDGPHGYETLAHHTAKHLIGRHLRQQFPDADVDVDTEAVTSGARPDVLLVLPGGRAVAYEVQYAPLTPEHWLARHRRYAQDGIRDVWLFGGPRYQRTPRHFAAEEGDLVIGPTLTAVLQSGHPLLLIDSEHEHVALGCGRDVVGVSAGTGGRGEFRPAWYPVGDARWPAGVLELPGMRDLLRECADAREREHKAAGRRIWLSAEAQRRQELRARMVAAAARVWAEERREIEAARGPLPSIVDVDLPQPATTALPYGRNATDRTVLTEPVSRWRWRLLLALETQLGVAVTDHWLQHKAFDDDGGHVGDTAKRALLDPFLVALRDAGYLWFAGTHRPATGEGVLVLGGADTVPDPPGRFPRRKLVRGRPVRLVKIPTGEVVWEAVGEAPVTMVRARARRRGPARPALLPLAAGTVIGQATSVRRSR